MASDMHAQTHTEHSPLTQTGSSELPLFDRQSHSGESRLSKWLQVLWHYLSAPLKLTDTTVYRKHHSAAALWEEGRGRKKKKKAEDALKVENTGSRLIEVKYGEKLKKWLCARCSCWKWDSPSQNFADMQINKGGPGREQRSGLFKRLNSCTGFISHHQKVSSYQRADVLLLN